MSWLPSIFRPAGTNLDSAAAQDVRTVAPPPQRPARTIVDPVMPQAKRPRLVLAVDATSSRAVAWDAAKRLTDALFTALPGELDVALAVHGGSKVHTFTAFTPDANELRQYAARVKCVAGRTRIVEIFERVLKAEGVRVLVYIGDVFEESHAKALRLANTLLLNDTRVIILHDGGSCEDRDGKIFQAIASVTGGAVLPFDASALDELGELLQAVAVLAVGGAELVEARQESMPAAPLLLERLAESKQLMLGGTKR